MFPTHIQGPVNDARMILILAEKFPYYKKLSLSQQTRFRKRLHQFTESKKFVPRQNFEITDEVRVMISACAIQLTFGLDYFMLHYFEYILVYPDVYQNPHTKNYHKGETNLAGFMCFSWRDIMIGISREHDNFNLGLHEFAHALRFNSFKGDENDYFFEGYFPKAIATGQNEFHKLKVGKRSIFRKYGGTNVNEFFSVIVEHWFESPEQFNKELPDLYRHVCILLNQDVMGNKIKTDVRNVYLQNSVPILSSVMGRATGYGGIKLVVAVFALLIFITIENINENGSLHGSWYFLFLIFCICFLVIIPKAKKILIFKEGILLSWLANGVFRHDPLYLLNENLITVEFVEDRDAKSRYTNFSKTIVIHYHYEQHFRTVELSCNFPLEQVREFIDHFRSNKINVVLRGFHRLK